jgi:hypothetical protein
LHERALPLTQIRAHFENQVALRQRALHGQLVEQVGRHYARASAEFENGAAADMLQDFAALSREAAAEQRRHFRRRDEVAARAELARTRAVVAEPGLVQRHLHEALEAEPAAARIDFFPDATDEAPAVLGFVGSERR